MIRALAEELGNPVAIDSYIRETWKIVPDPPEYEYVQAPVFQFNLANQNGYFSGDCDDAATLAGCLLAAISYPSRFVAIRLPNESDYSHVFLRCFVNSQPLDIDPIVPANLLPIRGIAQTMEVHVL